MSAVYNVARYLPEFAASIEQQTVGPSRIEVVVVDDGSGDGSLEWLQAWAARAPFPVVVLAQANAGQGAARNAGLDRATGDWITFADPDDQLDAGYLEALGAFAQANPDVAVISGKRLTLDEARGAVRDIHPRRWQFTGGSRVADLDVEPNVFPVSATTAAFRADRLRDGGVRFDPDLRPHFEDQHFAAQFILGLDRPLVGLAPAAKYIYRVRLTNDSTLQRLYDDPGSYTTVFERGYLDLVRRSRAILGRVAPWIQQLILYELTRRYFREADAISSRLAVPRDLEDRFHGLFGELARSLDEQQVYGHAASGLDAIWAEVLVHGFRDGRWVPARADRTQVDRAMGLQRIAYRYRGDAPVERFHVGAREVAPAFGKIRAVRYFGTELHERIAWVAADRGLRLELDGSPVPIGAPTGPVRAVDTQPAPRRRARKGSRVRSAYRDARSTASRLAIRVLAATVYRRRFRNAWVLADRLDDAGDNGERLFEYLRRERPDVNAWFVIRAGTPDWRRLKARGEPRLVAFGGRTWKLLMLNASWLLTSHPNEAVVRPKAMRPLVANPRWRHAFVQRTVITNDMSAWFNRRTFDMLAVSTAQELASVVGDGTAYTLTGKETRNTGLPRFDRLLQLGRAVPPDAVNLAIVAPTWRSWLTLPPAAGDSRRLLRDEFWTSDYLRRWLAILGAPEIKAALEQRGWSLGFMPHPELRAALDRIELPAHVQPLTRQSDDPQALYARCSLLVTDYSSVAFNTAYLDRPVVYYQFDRDLVEQGRHFGRRGYFEYERDGFGPVAFDHADAVAAILTSIQRGSSPAPHYQARIDAAFPVRDGNACARVVAAVEELSRPWRSAASGVSR